MLLTFAILLQFSQSSFSQISRVDVKTHRLKITKSAKCLFKSYNKIVQNKQDFDCDFPPQKKESNKIEKSRKYKWGSMHAKEFASRGKGNLSFLSSVWTSYKNNSIQNDTIIKNACKTFRTAWFLNCDDLTNVLSYCKGLYKKRNLYFTNVENTQNHVFKVVLVPLNIFNEKPLKESTFKQDEITDIADGELLKYAVDINTIKKINRLKIAKRSTMPKHLAAKFEVKGSSVGLVTKVSLKNNKHILCYVFNNYDGGESSTLQWKK